jgi:Na+-transporting methylmalonyl-CoA/oxaloacetate decarboxylase gamma subunit
VARWYGLELAVYGMGLVFLLLAVLWGMMVILLRLDRQPDNGRASVEAALPAALIVRGNVDALEPELLAAVVIACRAHRMTRRKQAAPEMRTHEPGSLPSRWVGSGRTRQNRSWAPGGRYA